MCFYTRGHYVMERANLDHRSLVICAENHELSGPRSLGFQYLSLTDSDDRLMPNLVTTFFFF